MENLTPHPKAELLRAIADGHALQAYYASYDEWRDCTHPISDLSYDKMLRIKPQWIEINGHKVLEPVRKPLEDGDEYYVPVISYPDEPWQKHVWTSDKIDFDRLKAGIIHFTAANALAHAMAVLSFTACE